MIAVCGLVAAAVTAQEAGAAEFSMDQQARLQELKQWLNQRNSQRGKPPSVAGRARGMVRLPPPVTLDEASRPIREFTYGENGQYRGVPKLHIGRGPDGRIYHRYVFSDAETQRVEPNAPRYSLVVPR